MTTPERLALLEALLFVSDRPLPPKEIAAFVSDLEAEAVEEALERLADRYEGQGGGLRVEKVAGGYRIATRPEHGEAVKAFFRFKNRQKLSRAALETLAIVAYRQPATHPEIQEIRGVASEGVLRTLLDRRLVRVAGRKDTVGQPLLYGTTREFLENFALGSLDDLPPIEELEALLAQVEETAGEAVSAAGDGAARRGEATAPPGTGPEPVRPVPPAFSAHGGETEPA